MRSNHAIAILSLAAAASAALATAPEVAPGLAGLNGLDREVQLAYRHDLILSDAFEAIGNVAGFSPSFDCSVDDRLVTLRMERMPVGRALTRLGRDLDLVFAVTGPAKLEVRGPGTTCAGEPVDAARFGMLDGLRDPDVPIVANFEQAPLPMLLRAVGRAGGVVVDAADGCSGVFATVDTPRRPFKRFLADLATQYDLAYAVPAPDRLEVSCGGHPRAVN